MDKLISVIVPGYNVENHLAKCLESICNQTYKHVEVILVNDGSSDGTLTIMQDFASRKKNIKVYSIDHKGVSVARNFALKHCSGDIISFVDADDWLDDKAYEVMLKTLHDTNSDICMCKYNKVYKNIKVETPDSNEVHVFDTKSAAKEILESDYYGQFLCNKIYKKHLFANEQFTESLFFEDVEIMYRLLDRSKAVSAIDKTLYSYYQRPDSRCHQISLKWISDQIGVYEALLSNSHYAVFDKQIHHRIFISLLDARVRNIYSKNTKVNKKQISKFTKDNIKRLKDLNKLNGKERFKSFFVLYTPALFVPKYWFANACLPQYAIIKNLLKK